MLDKQLKSGCATPGAKNFSEMALNGTVVRNDENGELGNQRLSWRYQKLVYKTPGSRLHSKNREDDALRFRQSKEVEKTLSKIFGTTRCQNFGVTKSNGVARSVTKPLCTATRLGRVVGKPIDRYFVNGANKSTAVGTRQLQNIYQREQHSENSISRIDFSDCESLVTLSDLDEFEAKSLCTGKNASNMSRNDFCLLRREISSIVSSNVDTKYGGSRIDCNLEKSLADGVVGEGMLSTEGCTTNGCVSFLHEGGTGMHEIFNDMREYWTVMVKE